MLTLCIHPAYTISNFGLFKQTYLLVRGRRTKNQLEWEKNWNKLIFSAMCPKRSPVTPLKVVKRGARCNMLICAQTCAHVIERGKISKSPKIRRFIP